jgi:hypothetical protein
MFSGVHYVTVDYMVYIQDGWITFAYWKPQFVINEKIEKRSKSSGSKENGNEIKPPRKTARLNVSFGNFQLHYFNSWKLDETLENLRKATRVTSQTMDGNETSRFNFSRNCVNSFINYVSKKFKRQENNGSATDYSEHDITEDLMQLFSVVNIRIQKGRIFAGNSTLPSIASIRISNAKMELVTEMSQSKVDEYCIILRGEMSKLEINFIPNKGIQPLDYKGFPIDKKSERLLVFRAASCDFEYIQDVPSIISFDRRFVQRSDTCDFVLNEKEPQWSLVLNCNKQTTINYGPYFDRQREELYKYFFPPTYMVLEPCPEPTLNERRQTSKFDFTINFRDSNTELNVIFGTMTNTSPLPDDLMNDPVNQKLLNDEMGKDRKLTLRCKAPSSIVCSFPWLTRNYGYKTTVLCDFNNVHCVTNLSFKHFLNGENMKLDININYPLRWNEMQVWNMDINLIKTNVYFTFFHKIFFQDLINDWSGRYMADIRTFAPYIYDIKLRGDDMEIILPWNQHNWIDVNILENNSNDLVFLICLEANNFCIILFC